MYNLSKGNATVAFNWGNGKITSLNMNGLNENEQCAKAAILKEHVFI